MPFNGSDTPKFVTVFLIDEGRDSVEEDWLREKISKFKREDDVFRPEFLSGVIFTASNPFSLSTTVGEVLRSEFGTTLIETVVSPESAARPEQGPYYLHCDQAFSIWKLCDDTQGAFLSSLVPEADR